MEKNLSDMVLKILIDERDLATMSYDRVKALAEKIARAVYGDDRAANLGTDFAHRLARSAEIEELGDREAAAGNHGEAFRLYMESFDLSLESTGMKL